MQNDHDILSEGLSKLFGLQVSKLCQLKSSVD